MGIENISILLSIATYALDVDQLSNIRKVETLLKLCIKKNVDVLCTLNSKLRIKDV